MLTPFFSLAAVSPNRQKAFRQAVLAHLLILSGLTLFISRQAPGAGPVLLGHIVLTLGVIEGALLVGWRLTQLPRSQALEFLLVSPLRPGQLFLAEALVGLVLLGLVTLSGLPALALLTAFGHLDALDLLPLTLLPFSWGAITGLGLTVWAYQSKQFRRAGEVVLLIGVLVYLVVGVLAGEKLRDWLAVLPGDWQIAFLRSFWGVHEKNPFGVLRNWLANDVGQELWPALLLQVIALFTVLFLLWQGAQRLEGHFHELHYEPVRDVRGEKRPTIKQAPLAWWAVKRVTQYSGKINLWLAGGFCLLYAAYIVGEAGWPAWLGKRIFQICDASGGVAMLGTALVTLAAVPAAFQYGLWDSSVQDRCRRLELLLLTDLQPKDYWGAAAQAAWVRGRGYFLIAGFLWLAGWLAGRLTLEEFLSALAMAVLMWGLYFALGFRAFACGGQANNLGLLLTVGLPVGSIALGYLGGPFLASCLPPGMLYLVGSNPPGLSGLMGAMILTGLTILISRKTLDECDAQLRGWYDQHHGQKVAQ